MCVYDLGLVTQHYVLALGPVLASQSGYSVHKGLGSAGPSSGPGLRGPRGEPWSGFPGPWGLAYSWHTQELPSEREGMCNACGHILAQLVPQLGARSR